MTEPGNRAKTGKFKPGQSGNPNGRPKTDMEFVDACRRATPEALEVILNIMRKAKYANDRLKAATWVAERAYGKAPQSLEVSGKDGQEPFRPVLNITIEK